MQHMNIGRTKEERKVNMKRKVINVSYRKDSNTFEDWMKYEIEILNEDGTTEKIPAYGKDLQDALRRVVHDEKVEVIGQKAKLIPTMVWVVLWFGYILGLTELATSIEQSNTVRSIVFMSGFVFVTGVVLWAKAWFRQRNLDR